jgi:integrase
MSKPQRPFTTPRRKDTKTFQITLNVSSGLPLRICLEWQRQSFQKFPDAMAQYRNPTNKNAAEAGAFALIQFLKNELEKDNITAHIHTNDITVGKWLEKFTVLETSPRTSRNANKNRPYSPATLDLYMGYYNAHIKEDPIVNYKMAELEEQDMLEFGNRMSLRRKKTKGKKPKVGELLGGTRTYAGIIMFVRMAFTEYQRTHPRWFNPFNGIDKPVIKNGTRDAITEDEMLRLFYPGILKTTMELAICAAMFLAGLRRSEIFALQAECLDWNTPKITVKHAWQRYDHKNRVLGPPKGKKERDAPFDPVLQDAIKKLWEENGKHDFVFCRKDGSLPGSSWIEVHFKKWLKAANIDIAGRKIVPHSARHSLASLLEERGVSIRYIQDLLGHCDFKTTKGYLHSTEATIRTIGKKITEARKQAQEKPENISDFKVS